MKVWLSKFTKFHNWLFKLFNNNIFVFSFCFFYVLILLMVFSRCYLVNDDVAILFDIQGGFSTSYMTVLLGNVLSFLYLHLWQNFPWYGLFLSLIHIISLFLFISSLAKIEKFKNLFLLFLFTYLSFYAFFIVAVSYNNASIMIGANSLFAFLIYLTHSRDKKKSLFIAALLGLLFSFSYLIRMEALLAILFFSLPVLLFFFFINIKKYRYFIAFIAPIILLFFLNYLVSHYFVSEEYKQFQGFRQVLSRLFTGPIYPDNKGNEKILAANYWTKNDYILIGNWFYFDEKKYNQDTFEYIFKYADSSANPSISERRNYSNYHSSLIIIYETYQLYILFLLLIILASLFFVKFRTSLILLSYLIYSSLAIIYMGIFLRFPTRIGDSLFLLIIGLSLALIFSNSKINLRQTFIKQFIKFLLVCCLLISIIFNSFKFYEYCQNIKSNFNKFNSDVNKLNTKYSEDIFIIPGWNLNFQFLDPLKKTPAFKFKKIEGGWPIFSPRFYESLRDALGVKYGYEMVPAMVDNDKVFLITTDSFDIFIQSLSTYFKENYNLDVAIIKVDNLSEANIYKVISQ